MRRDHTVPGFKIHGGKHCESAALNHVLRHYGVEHSEDFLFGLGGGIGFIYWYMKKMPAPLVGGRAGGRDFNLIENAVRRIGGKTDILTTGSARKAQDWLLEDLEAGRPVICYGDMAYLPYFGVREDEHFGGHVFVVYGIDFDGDRVWIADRGDEPFFVSPGDLARSRGSKHPPFPPANMTIRVHPPAADVDLAPGIRESIRGTVEGLKNAPISNVGVRGIKKWAAQVRTWPLQFPGRAFVDCLTSTYLYIELGGTGGSAFRRMYAGYLKEAAVLLGLEGLRDAAALYEACAKQWSAIAERALPQTSEALSRIKQLLIRRSNAMEHNGADTNDRTFQATRELDAATERAAQELSAEQADEIATGLSTEILALYALEQRALDSLSCVAG
jgi:hypothetical protein